MTRVYSPATGVYLGLIWFNADGWWSETRNGVSLHHLIREQAMARLRRQYIARTDMAA
jgi:hypothetical protein